MATTYKTPGVYIEEIVKFPPSVAQVETAIPAFIGYTQKAREKEEDLTETLNMDPKRITSMLEYEVHFGFPEKETDLGITITETDGEKSIKVTAPEKANRSQFLMYYSMQMYFANGGGPCYVVSVNTYADAIANNSATPVQFNDLTDGLATLEKEDEPTLLLFPDATSLANEADFYNLYNNALTQCKKMQDRFSIIDTYTDDEDVEMNDPEGVRNLISSDIDEKKYGAVYFPYLKTILDYHYDEDALEIVHNTDQPQLLSNTNDLLGNVADAQAAMAGLVTALTTADTALQAMTAGDALTNKSSVTDELQPVVDSLAAIVSDTNSIVGYANTAAANSNEDAVVSAAATAAADALEAIVEDGSTIATLIDTLNGHITTITDAANGTTVKTESANAVLALATVDATIQAVEDLITPPVVTAITNAQSVDPDSGNLDGFVLSAIKDVDSATYNNIKTAINNLPLELPPSSAMAGVYARVDSDRGVWKAPANVSVKYTVKPSQKITNDIQDRLNVDTIAGKSINAIRTFTGKGTLVWGARTLAGNDKEWRYVPVRRFFNMAEESIKKATEQFVFEPNDMNTWVRVKAMINNFLTLQWRAGALAGPTPDKAFYVNVGLGETMTANDILDGNMIIEIGMAVVRPAEFIILRFSHKMQEA
ncbi:phage tail sheath family protein [Aquimarina sp. 2201CG14-23]|uniref:phage tail sheath family protein n=1 Tax=Aquimarina mycalae TaxID=3040073 RepID=UPI002478179D|nr:phage tail sheath C-terminal domain-containing protein [Aquimarina sp. 2201CG14-23]MDH7444145.1 phage tail sheath C-terminal domain-containing protein [Aquimarina sp. 2201CG14-23]